MSIKSKIQEDLSERSHGTHNTGSPIGNGKWAIDTRAKGVHIFASDVVDSFAAAANEVTAASHVGLEGDIIRFTSGALSGREFSVYSVTTNTIKITEDLDVAPSGTDTFDLLRATTLTLTSGGESLSALSFTRDGSAQAVIEDTVDPTNNRALPVKLTDFSGDMVLNASNLNLEVQLSHLGANADAVRIGDGTETANVSASNELQVRDDDANTDLDTIAGAVAGTEMQVDIVDPGTIMLDTTGLIISGDTTSLDAKQPALGAAVIAASSPVTIASDQTVPISAVALPLPTGASTSALQTSSEAILTTIDTDTGTIAGDTTSLDAKQPALGTAVIASSTPVNIASDQTVPVSVSSLPLPSGAATAALQTSSEAILTTIDTDTGLIATDTAVIASDTTSLDAKLPAQGTAVIAASTPVNIASDQTVPVSAASLPLPTGAATEATLLTIDADTSALAGTVSGTELQVDILTTVSPIGRASVELIRNDYTGTPVTAAAYVELVASSSGDINQLQVFDSSGETLVFATGSAASEVDQFYIEPGGNGPVPLNIASGTRLSVKAVSATASVGELTITAFS